MKKHILLKDWAKARDIDDRLAKDWAFRGKLRGIATLRPHTVMRYYIDAGYKLPKV